MVRVIVYGTVSCHASVSSATQIGIFGNSIHPQYGATVPHVPVWVTRDALVATWYTYAYPLSRTSQKRRIFIGLSVSLSNYLGDPVFDSVGLDCFKI